jgi:prepilin-type N-terminal cleavage/methylation domain-containing protein
MRRFSRGMTLIEMVTTFIIFAIVATIAARMMSGMFGSYFLARDLTASDSQARVAFERMTRELRQIRTATPGDLDSSSGTQLRFFDIDGNGVCYYRDAVNNRLMRSGDGPSTACGTTNAQPLSDFTTGLAFFYYTSDGSSAATTSSVVYYVTVRVNILDNSVADTLRATIHPRNFP